jgi:hypothetical protein
MRRWRYADDTETHHTISANIIEAVGRGLLIATAGIVLGAFLGTADAGRFGAGLLAGSGLMGAACLVGSGLLRNADCRRREQEAEQKCLTADIMPFVAMQPLVIQHDTAEHGAEVVGYADRIRQERQQRPVREL